MQDAQRASAHGSGTGTSSVEIVLVVAVIALTVIVLGGWWALAGKTGALEKRLASSAREKGKLKGLSESVDWLSERAGKADENELAVRKLERRLSDLSRDVASLKNDDSRRRLASAVDGLKDSLSSIRRELALVKGLAEGAAKAPLPAPVVASGASAEEIAELARAMRGLEDRLASVEKRRTTTPKGPTGRVSEAAVRQMVQSAIDEGVNEAVDKAVKDFFENMRNRRRPPGRGE